jgi:phosphoglycolate phosphatase
LLKLVAFDCDGVLFDSRQANIAFYSAILERFGHPALTDPETIDYVHSHSARESLARLFPEAAELDEVLEVYKNIDYRPFIPMMLEEPHLREFLSFLRPDFFLAVATNRTTTTREVFRAHGLTDSFDLLVSAADVPRPKPSPDAFWRLLEHFAIEPHEAIYIGDSVVDEGFAENAGVPLVAYRNPGLKAQFYLDSFAQGPELIASLAPDRAGRRLRGGAV